MIQLFVTGTIRVNGVMTANGTVGSTGGGWGGGGGSGGSIWIECGALEGSGVIQADGGGGGGSLQGGGASGGRIALCAGAAGQFSGMMSVQGGAGYQVGEAGTFYANIAGGTNLASGDLNGDSHVDGSDLGILLAEWGCQDSDGRCGACEGADLNRDGVVGGADLGSLLGYWTGN